MDPVTSSTIMQQDETPEPPKKKVKALFSFMPAADSGTCTLSHGHSGTMEVNEYIDSASLPMHGNRAKFCT